MSTAKVLDLLRDRFPDMDMTARPLLQHRGRASDQLYIKVPPGKLIEVMTFLRYEPGALFEQLSDLAGVDYLNFPDAEDRYGVIYSLLSLTHGHRLWIKCFVNDPDPEIPSVTDIWNAANWMEREIYDMFGVRFTDHPDLRRILTWEGFNAHPLRKDYPLRGKGERTNYEIVTRESS